MAENENVTDQAKNREKIIVADQAKNEDLAENVADQAKETESAKNEDLGETKNVAWSAKWKVLKAGIETGSAKNDETGSKKNVAWSAEWNFLEAGIETESAKNLAWSAVEKVKIKAAFKTFHSVTYGHATAGRARIENRAFDTNLAATNANFCAKKQFPGTFEAAPAMLNTAAFFLILRFSAKMFGFA